MGCGGYAIAASRTCEIQVGFNFGWKEGRRLAASGGVGGGNFGSRDVSIARWGCAGGGVRKGR